MDKPDSSTDPIGFLLFAVRRLDKELAARARAAADAITEEEDAAITAAAMTDKDALPNRFIGKTPK